MDATYLAELDGTPLVTANANLNTWAVFCDSGRGSAYTSWQQQQQQQQQQKLHKQQREGGFQIILIFRHLDGWDNCPGLEFKFG